MEVVTNHHIRNTLYGYELTKKEREYFLDYINEENIDFHDFLCYRGHVYDLHEFEWIREDRPELFAQGWQGIITDSFFSGIVIKCVDDTMDQVIVGLVLA